MADQITTTEELDALPLGAAALGADGHIWQHTGRVRQEWRSLTGGGYTYIEDMIRDTAPLTVLYRPGQPTEPARVLPSREQIIEQMAQAHFDGLPDDARRFCDADDSALLLKTMGDGLPIAVRAVTARVRELAREWRVDTKTFDLPAPSREAIADDSAALTRLLDQIDAEWGQS